MRSNFLRLAVLVLLAGGCAGEISEMPTWVGFQEDNVEGADDVAVVVLKVVPPAQVLLAAGRIGPDGWRDKGPKSRVWLPARDGFVVAKASPTQDAMAYAVIQVRPDHLVSKSQETGPTYETGFWSAVPPNAGAAVSPPAYGPTAQARIPVFKAIARRVTFVGTIRIDGLSEPDGDEAPQKAGITPVASPDDIEAVRRFLSQHYAKITARVVPGQLQMLRWDETSE